jgi:L-Ala-D/L-Glu epimerase
MPHIASLTLHRRTIALRRPFVTAVRTAHAIEVLLLEARDSDGRSGWGEAPTSWRVTGESIEGVSAALEGPLRAAVEGLSSSDPDAASALMRRAVVGNSSARMALECALFDLAAQSLDVPLFRYLGGRTSEVRTDMTLSAVVSHGEIDAVCRTAAEFVEGGMNTLKIKVGAGGDDLALVVAVRRAVGDRIHLRLDANQGWSPEEAVRVISSLEDAGVALELVEQPVRADDIEGLAYVTAQVETPIMADESVWTMRELREVIRCRAANMVNVKIAKAGGLREANEMVRHAQAHDVRVIVGCMAESHVGIAAAASLASASASGDLSGDIVHDLDGGLLLAYSPVDGGVTYEGERVRLSPTSGNGITGLAPE